MLLVILMVSSTYIVAQSLKVQLPKSHSTDGTADKPATVTLHQDWRARVATAHDSNEDELRDEMKQARRRQSETDLVVQADKEVQHGKRRARPRSRQDRGHHQVRHQRQQAE